MRFGIRDLFVTVTLVASYAAMARSGLFGTMKRWTQHAGFTVWILVLFVAFSSWYFGRRSSVAGSLLFHLRMRLTWLAHFGLAATILSVGLIYRWIEGDESGGPLASVIPQFVAQAYAVMYAGCRSTVCAGGITMGRRFLPYRKHRFTVETRSSEAILDVDVDRSPRWLRYATLVVPPDRIAELNAILAAHPPAGGTG